MCTNLATGTVTHPVLGEVPCCDRCAIRHALTIKKERKAVNLTKSRILLDKLPTRAGASTVRFSNVADVEEGVTELRMDRNRYEEMDSPEQITVTVEPGDLLNGEGVGPGQEVMYVDEDPSIGGIRISEWDDGETPGGR
jgi:hypothetical protein